MKCLIKCCLPVGLIIWLVYQVTSHFTTIPDTIAIPMMIVSIILMMIGVAYQGWCFGKGKSPYDIKKKKSD